MSHRSVLLHESIDGLELKAGDIFVDATINGGGHSELVANKFGSSVRIIGIDLDVDALVRAEKRLEKAKAQFSLHNHSFRNLDKVLEEAKVGKIDRILFDLGWSSNQFEESGRGFSFQKDEHLLMTFKKEPTEADLTAYEIVNTWDEANIADIVYGYGEERYARRIAKKIIEAREIEPIETTFQLVRIVEDAVPAAYKRGKINPATKTFQALRITVNDEMRALREGLQKAFEYLKGMESDKVWAGENPRGGRMAVISFHSIEDRIVKQFMKGLEKEGKAILIHKKPVVPSVEEVQENRRARSAKLRILEKQ